MNIEVVPIDSLTPNPDNARMHTQRNIDVIRHSLETFGQRGKVLVVDGNDVIHIGNGTWLAAKQLGWTEIKVERVTDLTPTQIRALALVDNRATDLSTWDPTVLDAELSALRSEDVDLAVLGFDEGEVANMLANISTGSIADDMETGETADGKEYDETVADGLVLKSAWQLTFPLEAAATMRAALEGLRAEVPELKWKEGEAV